MEILDGANYNRAIAASLGVTQTHEIRAKTRSSNKEKECGKYRNENSDHLIDLLASNESEIEECRRR
jgi:hypothetical protein